MLQQPVHHVGDCLEAAVRMPRRALRLTRPVVDLAHLVQMDEGVERCEVYPGEGTEDGEALAFEAARSGRDGPDGSLGGA